MSHRFLQIFFFMLVVPCLTYASAPSGWMRLSHATETLQSLTNSKKLSKPPSDPVKFEKFILQPASVTRTDAVTTQPEEKSETVPPGNTATNSGSLNLSAPAQPLLTSSSRRPTLIDKTYLDAFTILQDSNTCSMFFGGPRIATGVLNSLYPTLQTALLDNHVGIRMSGPFTVVTDHPTGLRYRLFKKATINVVGPFYRSADDRHHGFFQKVGYYTANTREARVTMLLHELGHLVSSSEGRWLLADDGDNHTQVELNTAAIMKICSEQIKSLRQKQ